MNAERTRPGSFRTYHVETVFRLPLREIDTSSPWTLFRSTKHVTGFSRFAEESAEPSARESPTRSEGYGGFLSPWNATAG